MSRRSYPLAVRCSRCRTPRSRARSSADCLFELQTGLSAELYPRVTVCAWERGGHFRGTPVGTRPRSWASWSTRGDKREVAICVLYSDVAEAFRLQGDPQFWRRELLARRADAHVDTEQRRAWRAVARVVEQHFVDVDASSRWQRAECVAEQSRPLFEVPVM